MTRADLVAAARSLVEAVAMTDLDDDGMRAAATRLTSLDSELRAERLPSVPRTAFADAVGEPQYTWQWANPGLPRIDMTFEGRQGTARFDRGLSAVYAGPPGLLHGGVASMLLDAVLASLVQFHGIPSVTASLTTDFRGPTPVDTPFEIRAQLDDVGDRKIQVSGALVVDGVEAVQARGLWIRVDPIRIQP